ncbi:MAG: hypothetical protein FWE34_05805, partial [Defluviitaleaceae bacterium]|nr:hypothetical protein [Defluviitaleaceae bacterium]
MKMGFYWNTDSPVTYEMITGESSPDDNVKSGNKPTALHKAMYFLEIKLRHGKLPSSELYAYAKLEGFSESTLKRAATELGVDKSEMVGVGENRVHYWKLKYITSNKLLMLASTTSAFLNELEAQYIAFGNAPYGRRPSCRY